jgi:hypothetical protein
LDVFVVIEGEVDEEGVEVFDEVAEDGDLRFLLDECDGPRDQPLLGVCAADALVDQGEAAWGGGYNLTRLKMGSLDLKTDCRTSWMAASDRAAV